MDFKSSIGIIDGHYLAHRALYSQSSNLTNSKGVPTGIIFTVLKMIYSYKDLAVDLIMVFDWGRPQFRKDLLPGYKQRESNPEKEKLYEVFNQSLVLLKEILPKMGIPVVTIKGWEGDDVIFRLSQNFIKEGKRTIVLSDDSDYSQFLNIGCEIYKPMKSTWFDKEDFKTSYGYESKYFVLAHAVTGTHNNVPGIKGIGKKTVAKIINQLKKPTVEELFLWAENEPEQRLNKKILENKDLIKRNIKLVDLNIIPLTVEETSTVFNEAKKQSTPDPLFIKEKFIEWEFKSLSNILIWVCYK